MMIQIPPPHPGLELTWDEAGELTGLLGDAYRQIAPAGGAGPLAARLLQAIEALVARQLSAWPGAGQ